MGVISRAHSLVSVWFPNISFRGINFFPQQALSGKFQGWVRPSGGFEEWVRQSGGFEE